MKPELDDIVKGLDDSGYLEKLRAFPDLFCSLFVQERLTAGNVKYKKCDSIYYACTLQKK